jgi:5-deoxy-5-amino-3-dehydroquinate synthase
MDTEQATQSPAVARAEFLRVPVSLGDRSYEVVIGRGARHLLKEFIPPAAKRAAIVTQRGINVEVDPGIPSKVFYMGDGEHEKSLATIERLCQAFVEFGLTRADVVIAVGGGVVTDTAGFAAASYHRGVDLINVATTLLGQVDAGIGGKTAVNLAEGKNLVGAFWQPRAVLCDTEVLATLPDRERRSGNGEMAKYAFLGIDNLDSLSLDDQIGACVRLKAQAVAADEREGDQRMLLNYGHTLAHALETAGFADGPGRDGIDLRHGEAVAIGLIFAARLARHLGRIDDHEVERHYEVMNVYGLPTILPHGVDHKEIVGLMSRDKKATDGLIFILDGPSGVEIVRGVEDKDVFVALDLISE